MGAMLQNAGTVFEQVLVLFLIACIGYICGKREILTEDTANGLASICLYAVAPCLMISSFQRSFALGMLWNFLLTFAFAMAAMAISIVLTGLTIRDRDARREKVLRSGVIFPNCGMVSLALEQALYGADGVFYGAAYIAAFNLVFWTYGVFLLGSRQDISWRKILRNPGILGTAAGLIFFFASIRLPGPLKAVSDQIAGLNTPLAMLVIGERIAFMEKKALFTDKGAVWASVQRLLLFPLISILGLWVLGIEKEVGMICVIAASAPAAACNTMLAMNLGQDSALSAKMVSLSTAASMFTMPIMIVLAQAVL